MLQGKNYAARKYTDCKTFVNFILFRPFTCQSAFAVHITKAILTEYGKCEKIVPFVNALLTQFLFD
jgi:hypothetical protein